mmetsp:Transcript_23421/g.51205  ORF Transcript_23421/g.51205 Transcript_23421/m.51205 type:complete len:390 (-) Transcript_23421:981-2150(-)|eukprot:CAMPEP_0118923174 /NCGR_PEP_ID=MMETSP1169-20130426/1797_1 /TAXON_ID=36882 /ORGANISM="Pyramimonas obovata, Strain CCMP722" /LENGTH=389 /DNA_ID=CAMNT_0006864125 /DNA_START=172 /DNA_END=1341 /DNA_ORIENTATION=-
MASSPESSNYSSDDADSRSDSSMHEQETSPIGDEVPKPRGRPAIPKLSLSLASATGKDAGIPSKMDVSPQADAASSGFVKDSIPTGVPSLRLGEQAPTPSSFPRKAPPPPLDLPPSRIPSSPAPKDLNPVLDDDERTETTGSQATVVVDMLSSAFQVPIPPCSTSDVQEAGVQMMDVVTKRCSAGLGICPESLEFYEIRPLAPEEASTAMARGSHVGVRVKGSAFTLAAVEALLEEQAKLVENLDQSNAALDRMREECSAHSLASATASSALAAEEAQARQLSDSCQALDAEVATLRQQLQRADELRMQSQKSLDELKAEFEALTKDIAEDGLLAGTRRSPASPGGVTAAKSAAVVSSPRALSVMERLCSDEMLNKLENILDSVSSKHL